MKTALAQIRGGLRGTFALMAVMSVLGLSGLALVIGRLRRNSADLGQRARNLEREMIERQRVEEALQRARAVAEAATQAKSAFLANMSRELRTPMNAILGFTRLVMRRSQDVLPQRQYENESVKIRGRWRDLARQEQVRETENRLFFSFLSSTTRLHT